MAKTLVGCSLSGNTAKKAIGTGDDMVIPYLVDFKLVAIVEKPRLGGESLCLGRFSAVPGPGAIELETQDNADDTYKTSWFSPEAENAPL